MKDILIAIGCIALVVFAIPFILWILSLEFWIAMIIIAFICVILFVVKIFS